MENARLFSSNVISVSNCLHKRDSQMPVRQSQRSCDLKDLKKHQLTKDLVEFDCLMRIRLSDSAASALASALSAALDLQDHKSGNSFPGHQLNNMQHMLTYFNTPTFMCLRNVFDSAQHHICKPASLAKANWTNTHECACMNLEHVLTYLPQGLSGL